MPRTLDEAQVRAHLTMPDLIEAMAGALASFSAGTVTQPVRTVLDIAGRGFFGLMPAHVSDPDVFGAKLVTVFHENPERGLPSHLATILLFDSHTGELRAILDGRYITEARTAAVSAVSTRYLAKHDAAVLAILGSGVQARSHLEALREVRDIREVRAWSPTPEHLHRFTDETGATAAPSAEAAVRGADIVVLATASATPAIEDAWVAPGAHVISVGACRPSQREMDPRLIARARLFVDSRAAALKESGDVVIGIREGLFDENHIAGEVGDLVLGRARGRSSVDEVTIFKSLGLAVEDVVSAQLAYRRATAASSFTTS